MPEILTLTAFVINPSNLIHAYKSVCQIFNFQFRYIEDKKIYFPKQIKGKILKHDKIEVPVSKQMAFDCQLFCHGKKFLIHSCRIKAYRLNMSTHSNAQWEKWEKKEECFSVRSLLSLF